MDFLKGAVLVLEGVVQIFGIRAGVEEPAYRVLERRGQLELREYGARLVAETVVEGEGEAARTEGFRRVANYIFGDNESREQVAMTAPVAQRSGKSIAMTTPVVQAPSAAGGAWTIQFVMPAKYRRIEDLPKPKDPQVQISEEAPARYAVRRFTGSRSARAVESQTKMLLGDVALQGWQASSAPVAWFYDPPWTIPWARRNEVAVRIPVGP